MTGVQTCALPIFLTGSNQAFDNVKGGEPNAAVGKKWKRIYHIASVGAMTMEVETKDKNQLNYAASILGIFISKDPII